jgi:hypothetical protein
MVRHPPIAVRVIGGASRALAIFNPIRSKAFGFRVCLYRANRHLKETPMAVVEGSPSPSRMVKKIHYVPPFRFRWPAAGRRPH